MQTHKHIVLTVCCYCGEHHRPGHADTRTHCTYCMLLLWRASQARSCRHTNILYLLYVVIVESITGQVMQTHEHIVLTVCCYCGEHHRPGHADTRTYCTYCMLLLWRESQARSCRHMNILYLLYVDVVERVTGQVMQTHEHIVLTVC